MGNDKQIQKAGDNSQLYQAGTIVVNNGITEERARAICDETSKKAIEECSIEARRIAEERIAQLANVLIPRLQQVESDFHSLSEPDYQVLLRKAQITAACSGKEDDYKLLSELLVHRIKNKDDRKIKASISKAVEIVDQIDDDALCALTIVNYMSRFHSIDGSIDTNLRQTNANLNSLNCAMLPTTTDWMAHLDLLNAIRVSDFGRFNKYDLFLTNIHNGFTSVGIEKESPQHHEAIRLIQSANLPPFTLVEHELLPGYMRLAIDSLDDLDAGKVMVFNGFPIKTYSQNDVRILKQIWSMYSKDAVKQEAVKNAFLNKCRSFNALKSFIDWYNQLPNSFTITPVGRALAHANAERLIEDFPKFNP